jgi:hypothetical protein
VATARAIRIPSGFWWVLLLDGFTNTAQWNGNIMEFAEQHAAGIGLNRVAFAQQNL